MKSIQILIILYIVFLTNSFAAEVRIINGNQVQTSDTRWKFIVSFRYDDEHYCGGSLIAPNWVLTAAHCWVDENGAVYNVDSFDKIGVKDYKLANQVLYPIHSVVVHQDFDDYTLNNDIALVQLTNPITDVPIVILDYTLNLDADFESRVAGWGVTSVSTQEMPENLMHVKVPIINNTTCAIGYGDSLTSNMICAGYMSGGKDSCQGDSGGPLISENNGQWLQSGIVSWGSGCAEENQPGVYTKVQNYTAWIESYTGELEKPGKKDDVGLPSIINYLLN